MKWLGYACVFVAGLLLGWFFAGGWSPSDQPPAPGDWLARVNGEYLTTEEFIDEMRRRGGTRPGQYQTVEQRQALLDDLLYRRALVAAAREQGLDRNPQVRRSRDAILVTQYLQDNLRPRQEAIRISDREIRQLYEAQAEEYTIPARRRVAMIRINVPAGASEETREALRARAEQARQEALELNTSVFHFGTLARQYSEDPGSRYRNGVIGWISEAAPERYRHDPVVVTTANAMTEPGQVSDVLEGEGALYLVRLVDYQPARARSMEELADGLSQRLRRDRHNEIEVAFRHEVLDRLDIEVRADRLEQIDPVGPPRPDDDTPRPPPMPVDN